MRERVCGARDRSRSRTGSNVKRVSCLSDMATQVVVPILLTVLLPNLAMAGDISCQGMRYTYINKGLDLKDIPRSPKQGKAVLTDRLFLDVKLMDFIF